MTVCTVNVICVQALVIILDVENNNKKEKDQTIQLERLSSGETLTFEKSIFLFNGSLNAGRRKISKPDCVACTRQELWLLNDKLILGN